MTTNRKRFVFPGILLGIVILATAITFKPSPDLQANYDKARVVDVISLHKQVTAPIIKSFGRISPKYTLQGIAEVNGKIVYRHPELETGRLIKKGTLVLQIEPLQYELKVAQAAANLQASQVQLTRITQEQENANASLDIEQLRFTLIDQEYQRKESLNNKNLISSSELDNQKQLLLTQRNLIQELSNVLSLLPADRKVLEAQINVNQAELENAQRELDNTRFILPFDARIAEVNIEKLQAVSTNEVLFEAHQLGVVEVKAELSLKDANILINSIGESSISDPLASIEKLNFNAEIEMNIGKRALQWPAKLTRVADNINPEQATIAFYLEVMQDSDRQGLVNKQLLSKGMFVTANIEGFSAEQFVVPEKALRGNNIYIMDKQQKLQIIDVEILFRNRLGVAISGDINEGDLLVLNDLIPAVPGMGLKLNNAQSEQINTESAQ